ncbi:MAG TPA: DUF488 family protein [Hyphomicrobium sp.]|mgnify:CR=1 FL=1|nr:DUF488 family protein [Hyphomicrobium sp.]
MTRAPRIAIARAYDELPRSAGARLLVDRIWPRGVSRHDLQIDEWIRDVAPSAKLRKWFGHDPARWEEFQRRYRAELDSRPEAVERCLVWCRKGPVLLLFGARDREHNQAVVLRDYLSERVKG